MNPINAINQILPLTNTVGSSGNNKKIGTDDREKSFIEKMPIELLQKEIASKLSISDFHRLYSASWSMKIKLHKLQQEIKNIKKVLDLIATELNRDPELSSKKLADISSVINKKILPQHQKDEVIKQALKWWVGLVGTMPGIPDNQLLYMLQRLNELPENLQSIRHVAWQSIAHRMADGSMRPIDRPILTIMFDLLLENDESLKISKFNPMRRTSTSGILDRKARVTLSRLIPELTHDMYSLEIKQQLLNRFFEQYALRAEASFQCIELQGLACFIQTKNMPEALKVDLYNRIATKANQLPSNYRDLVRTALDRQQIN